MHLISLHFFPFSPQPPLRRAVGVATRASVSSTQITLSASPTHRRLNCKNVFTSPIHSIQPGIVAHDCRTELNLIAFTGRNGALRWMFKSDKKRIRINGLNATTASLYRFRLPSPTKVTGIDSICTRRRETRDEKN